MRVGIFTGSIVLDKSHFNVRQLYVTERLKHLINYNDLDITVICPSGISEELKDLNCNYIFYKIWRRRHFKILTALIPSFLKLLKIDCDILHIHSNELAMSAIIAQKFRRNKFKILFEPMGLAEEELKVHMCHSWKARLLSPYTTWRERWILENSDGIIAYTDAMRDYYLENYGFLRRDNIFVVPHGIDLNFKTNSNDTQKIKKLLNIENKKVVVYSGNLSELHGTRTLINAMEIIKKHDDKVLLILLGAGELLPTVIKLVKENHLDNVVIKGHIPREEVPDYLHLADVLVIPHTKCGQTEADAPTKLYEYLASGKPIVASKLKAIAEVTGENAVLVEPDNPQALAQGILKVLNGKGLARRIGENGKNIVKNYSWEESARRAYEAYKITDKLEE